MLILYLDVSGYLICVPLSHPHHFPLKNKEVQFSILFPSFPPRNLTFSFLTIALCNRPLSPLAFSASHKHGTLAYAALQLDRDASPRLLARILPCLTSASLALRVKPAFPCPSPRTLSFPGNIAPDGVPALLFAIDEIMSLKSGSLTRGRSTPFRLWLHSNFRTEMTRRNMRG